MPAFTFEKIAPPSHLGQVSQLKSSSAPEQKHRSTIVQVLGRFVDARVKRVDQGTLTRRPQALAKRELPK